MKQGLTVPRLKVVSAVSSNLAIVWFAASLTTKDPLILFSNIFLAIVFVYMAVWAEEKIYHD
jgi:hypothetical protein